MAPIHVLNCCDINELVESTYKQDPETRMDRLEECNGKGRKVFGTRGRDSTMVRICKVCQGRKGKYLTKTGSCGKM